MKNYKKSNKSKSVRKGERYGDNAVRDNRGSAGMRSTTTGAEYAPMKSYESAPNDWRWYAQNEQILRDTASFAYGYPVGNRLDLGAYVPDINKGSIPGIASLHFAPTFGGVHDTNSPLNVAARNVYSYVRHANSGSKNYDAPDLMLYLLAMDSVYSYIAFLKRVYGVAMTYNIVNRYYPKAVVESMGVQFEDLMAHMADFRAAINILCVKAGSLCVPANMSYMAKHMWMYSGLYLDSQSSKAQTYVFTPATFYQFGLDTDSAGQLTQVTPFTMQYLQAYSTDTTRCVVNEWTYTQSFGPIDARKLLTVESLIQFGNSLLDPILASEDMNVMSGDILKAYSENMIFKLDLISENYTVIPKYDEDVLDQIQNATAIGIPEIPGLQSATSVITPSQALAVTLKQDPSKGWLTWNGHFYGDATSKSVGTPLSYGRTPYLMDRILTFNRTVVEPRHSMEASRWCNICTESSVTGTDLDCDTLGSEVLGYVFYHNFTQSQTSNQGNAWVHTVSRPVFVGTHVGIKMEFNTATVTKDDMSYLNNSITRAIGYAFRNLSVMSQFNRHPMTVGSAYAQMSVVGSDEGPSDYQYFRPDAVFMDVDYYTVVNQTNLREMSQTALISMFDVTQYGRSSGK